MSLFYLKSGDFNPVKFKSSDTLVDLNNTDYYMSEGEATSKVDRLMISKFYREHESHDLLSNSEMAESMQKTTSEIQLKNEDF